MRKLISAPLHPIFTHFTVALTVVSLAFDVLGVLLDDATLAAAGWWTIAAAVPATVGALASGVTSRRRMPMEEGRARRWLRAHMLLGPTFFGGLVMLAIWRAALWGGSARPGWSYLIAMGALVVVMTAQGFIGGELVFRFGAEVQGRYARLPSERGDRTPPSALPGAASTPPRA